MKDYNNILSEIILNKRCWKFMKGSSNYNEYIQYITNKITDLDTKNKIINQLNFDKEKQNKIEKLFNLNSKNDNTVADQIVSLQEVEKIFGDKDLLKSYIENSEKLNKILNDHWTRASENSKNILYNNLISLCEEKEYLDKIIKSDLANFMIDKTVKMFDENKHGKIIDAYLIKSHSNHNTIKAFFSNQSFKDYYQTNYAKSIDNTNFVDDSVSNIPIMNDTQIEYQSNNNKYLLYSITAVIALVLIFIISYNLQSSDKVKSDTTHHNDDFLQI